MLTKPGPATSTLAMTSSVPIAAASTVAISRGGLPMLPAILSAALVAKSPCSADAGRVTSKTTGGSGGNGGRRPSSTAAMKAATTRSRTRSRVVLTRASLTDVERQPRLCDLDTTAELRARRGDQIVRGNATRAVRQEEPRGACALSHGTGLARGEMDSV